MTESSATRILEAWSRLEAGLRQALPVCAVQPPTQPLEMLSALRINGQLGPDEEEEVLALREIRNRVAHSPEEPEEAAAEEYESKVEDLLSGLGVSGRGGPACDKPVDEGGFRT